MTASKKHPGGTGGFVETYFAPAERASEDKLAKQLQSISNNPVIDGVMQSVSGLLAVLNEHRQILTVNNALLEMLGIENADDLLGLRPGEAVQCIHASEMPGGCGTSKSCPTCGAAIAIVSSLDSNEPKEEICVATVKRGEREDDLYLRVRSCPITISEKRFILLFLQDATAQQRRAALEKVFFHDISNLAQGLQMASHLMDFKDEDRMRYLVDQLREQSTRLAKEIEIQRTLFFAESGDYTLAVQNVSVKQIFDELKNIFSTHPAAKDKDFSLPGKVSPLSIRTDPSLLVRILTNMTLNAFEATDPGGEVKAWLEHSEEGVSFCVWNQTAIPEKIRLRIFQRNFTTKGESGRGLGTHAMKLFGEHCLGGKVDFTTSEDQGTVFRFTLPQEISG